MTLKASDQDLLLAIYVTIWFPNIWFSHDINRRPGALEVCFTTNVTFVNNNQPISVLMIATSPNPSIGHIGL